MDGHRFVPRIRPQRQRAAQTPRRWHPGMACSICGEQIHRWQRFNFDHVIPMGLGGPRGRSNKAPAHVLCNLIKGCRYPFALKTEAERHAIQNVVTPQTWVRLLRIWNGQAD